MVLVMVDWFCEGFIRVIEEKGRIACEFFGEV